MKDILKRSLIVAWIFNIIFLIFILFDQPYVWYASFWITLFIWAIQFISLGIINPAKLLESRGDGRTI